MTVSAAAESLLGKDFHLKIMKNESYELLALIFFILAGFFYLTSACLSGDVLVIIGTIIWLAACFIWLVPATRNWKQAHLSTLNRPSVAKEQDI